VKPILSGLTFILSMSDTYDEGDFTPTRGYLYITVFDNISITISLYFLVLFYHATKDILAPYKPVSKFLSIKSIIFFSFWQGVVISVMVFFNILFKPTDNWSIGDVSTATQNFLVCFEMVPVSIAFAFTFGYRSFKSGSSDRLLSGSGAVGLIKNFSDIANVSDVLSDTRLAIRKDPSRKRVEELDHFLTLSVEDQNYYTLLKGWLAKKGEDLVKSWKKRYVMLLKHPSGIAYFKMDPYDEAKQDGVKARGWIPLANVTGIEPRRDEAFNLVTNNRTFRFKCSSQEERNNWIKNIADQLPEHITVNLENVD